MKKTIILLMCFLMSSVLLPKLRVATAYPYMKDITDRIGKDKVKVIALSPGNWDPHVIVPRPSLIAQVRRADLLIINGAQLEIGWMPPVIRQANNAKVMPSKKGFLDLSTFIKLIQVPDTTALEYDGSLSGARVREGISWGKVSEKAKQVTIEGDATVLLPLMIKAVLERIK